MNVAAATMTAALVCITLAAYVLALEVKRRWNSPFANPVLISTPIVIAYLWLAHLTTTDYAPAKALITALLGPATVALAVPLYRNRALFVANILTASVGLVAGSLVTMVVCGSLARIFALPPTLVASLSIKSATAPIAIEIAKIVHGDPATTAVFVVSTGIMGAIGGPWLMDRLGVATPLARGLALGTVSHGIGTAAAAAENEFAGAMGGIAMGFGALVTASIAPIVVPLLAR